MNNFRRLVEENKENLKLKAYSEEGLEESKINPSWLWVMEWVRSLEEVSFEVYIKGLGGYKGTVYISESDILDYSDNDFMNSYLD